MFQQHGLTVRIIPAQHVKPFVRGNKNDKNDALAIAAMRWPRKRDDQFSQWVNKIISRRGYQKVNVALAHKLARIIWAMLRDHKTFKHHVI